MQLVQFSPLEKQKEKEGKRKKENKHKKKEKSVQISSFFLFFFFFFFFSFLLPSSFPSFFLFFTCTPASPLIITHLLLISESGKQQSRPTDASTPQNSHTVPRWSHRLVWPKSQTREDPSRPAPRTANMSTSPTTPRGGVTTKKAWSPDRPTSTAFGRTSARKQT